MAKSYERLNDETERIVPLLARKMGGNGGLRIDTDVIDLTDPRDYHTMEWLGRLTAGFVLEERDVQLEKLSALRMRASHEQDERFTDHLRLANLAYKLKRIAELVKAETLNETFVQIKNILGESDRGASQEALREEDLRRLQEYYAKHRGEQDFLNNLTNNAEAESAAAEIEK